MRLVGRRRPAPLHGEAFFPLKGADLAIFAAARYGAEN
jgi:hypothetical protein